MSRRKRDPWSFIFGAVILATTLYWLANPTWCFFPWACR